MLSLLRSMLTSISVALKDKNSLLSLFSVFLLRRKEDSGVWVEVLPFMGNKEDAWWGPGSSCVLSLENKCALTWDTSHCHLLWVYEVMSNLTVPFGKAQCAPLTAFRLKTGQYWGTWWWRNHLFLMIGSGPDNLVKWSWKQPASTYLFLPDVLRPACSCRILRSCLTYAHWN